MAPEIKGKTKIQIVPKTFSAYQMQCLAIADGKVIRTIIDTEDMAMAKLMNEEAHRVYHAAFPQGYEIQIPQDKANIQAVLDSIKVSEPDKSFHTHNIDAKREEKPAIKESMNASKPADAKE